MEQDPETRLLENHQVFSWAQLTSFSDPLMVIENEGDRAMKAVEDEAERLGLTIQSTDMTFEIQVRAYAK